MDVKSSGTTDGTWVQVWDCNGELTCAFLKCMYECPLYLSAARIEACGMAEEYSDHQWLDGIDLQTCRLLHARINLAPLTLCLDNNLPGLHPDDGLDCITFFVNDEATHSVHPRSSWSAW
jgi:hypothetical protein